MSDLYEQLASIQHDIWASWQKYLHSKLTALDRQTHALGRSFVEHWNRQIDLPYNALTEKEKDSDREQVDKFWPLIEQLQADIIINIDCLDLQIAENEQLKNHAKRIETLVNEQAEDEGLWVDPVYASEAYLQQELRKLHALIEGNNE